MSIDNFIYFEPFEESNERYQITIDDEVLDLSEGVSFDVIKSDITTIGNRFNSLIVALSFANIGKITNLHHPKLANGHFNVFDTNISEEMRERDNLIPRKIVTHEFFHSVQAVIGTLDANADSAVAFSSPPDEWEPIIFPHAEDSLAEIHNRTKELWFRFRSGEFEPLCEYQTKNISELFAVAFEAYVHEPETLETHQPDIHTLIERIVL